MGRQRAPFVRTRRGIGGSEGGSLHGIGLTAVGLPGSGHLVVFCKGSGSVG